MRAQRLIVPVIAGVAVFGTVSAFAASLNLTSDSLGSGQAPVTSCAPGTGVAAVDVSYTTAFVAGAYQVTDVTFAAPSCAGLPFKATLLSGTTVLATASGTIDAAAHAVTAASATPVLASAVDGLAVVISG